MSAVLDKAAAAATDDSPKKTDGFHLVIDALKLNDLDTIFALPGIPITDLTRMAQAEGMRVISFRHEQHAGNAAAAAGFLTQKPGICLTVSAPGFLNGLTALANATTNCFPMILISGSSEREIVDLQQGDYEEMDQLAIARPLCKAAYRVLHAGDIGVGVARTWISPPGFSRRPWTRRRAGNPSSRWSIRRRARFPRRKQCSARWASSSTPGAPSSCWAKAPRTRRRMPTSAPSSKRAASPTFRCRWPRACCRTTMRSAHPPRARMCWPKLMS